MKKSTKKTYLDKNRKELLLALGDNHKELSQWLLKKDKVGAEIMRGSHLRREIARIQTLLHNPLIK